MADGGPRRVQGTRNTFTGGKEGGRIALDRPWFRAELYHFLGTGPALPSGTSFCRPGQARALPVVCIHDPVHSCAVLSGWNKSPYFTHGETELRVKTRPSSHSSQDLATKVYGPGSCALCWASPEGPLVIVSFFTLEPCVRLRACACALCVHVCVTCLSSEEAGPLEGCPSLSQHPA